MNEAADDPRIGSIVGGRYRLIERVAEGGMGVVYKGERLTVGRRVAIKFLPQQFTKDEEALSRLERESMAISQISHPNCVSVIDFGVEGAPYVVMEFVHGKTLLSLLNEGPVPVGRSIHIVKQLLVGLAEIHNHGIIHQDVKPGSIMLSEATGVGDHVRIFDFGLAMLQASTSDSAKQSPSLTLGTPAYMSPEQTLGNQVDIRSDLYSTGIVLFELLSGRKPFFDNAARKVMRMQQKTPPPRLASASNGRTFSAELEAVIAKALAKAPEERFQTAREFTDGLTAVPENQLSFLLEELVPPRGIFGSFPSNEAREMATAKPSWLQAIRNLRIRAFFDIALDALKVFRNRRVPAVIIALAAVTVLTVAACLLAKILAGAPSPRIDQASDVDTLNFEIIYSTGEDPVDAAADAGDSVADNSALDMAFVFLRVKKYNEAIKVLRKLQQADPTNALYPYTLGDVYFERSWYQDSIQFYRLAIQTDALLRDDKDMNEHLIAMLEEKKNFETLRHLFVFEIGQDALPYLQQAALNNPNKGIRDRAKSIAAEISSSQ